MDNLPVVIEGLPLRQSKFSAPPVSAPQTCEVTPSSQLATETLPTRAIVKQTDNRVRKTRYYDIPQEDRPLTRKQKMAVEALVSGKARTQAAAARLAGYSECVAQVAYIEVFSKPNVRKELNRRREQLYGKMEMKSNDIVRELQILSEANLADYITINDDGSFKVDLSRTTREQLAAIECIEFDAVGRPKIKLYNKRAVLMDIAKLKGIGTETIHTNAENPLTIQALDAIIANSTTNNVTINQQINVTEKDLSKFLPQSTGKVIEQEQVV